MKKIFTTTTVLAVLILSLTLNVFATNRYWVGGGSSSNWNATSPTNWSASSGGANNASIPTAADDVFFTGAGGGASNSTISSDITIRSLNCAGYSNTLTHNAGVTLSIGDATAGAGNIALNFPYSMTYAKMDQATSAISFISTSSTVQTIQITYFQIINKQLGNTTFNGVGGSWQLAGELTIGASGTLSIINGTLNQSTYGMYIGKLIMGAGGTLTLSGYAFYLSGTGTIFDNNAAGTVNTGTGIINITDQSNTAVTFAGGGKTYNNIWFSRGASTASITISGNNTFNDFNDKGSAAHSILFAAGSSQTVNTFTVSGTADYQITINSDDNSSTHTLVKAGGGTISCDYLNIQHSVASPSNTWFAGATPAHTTNNQATTSAGSGWIFAPAGKYWNPAADANWGDANVWALTDGGDPTGVATPTQTDNVFFSNTNLHKCTIGATSFCANLDFTYGTGYTGILAGNSELYNYGSLTMKNGMTNNYTGTINFQISGFGPNLTITSNGITFAGNIMINGSARTFLLGSNLTLASTKTLTVQQGTLSAVNGNNNYVISTGLLYMNSVGTLTLGSATHLLTGTGNVCNITSANSTVNANTSTINITDASATAKTFAGYGRTFNNLCITGAGTGTYTISGNNTFNTLTIDRSAAPKTVNFTAGTTQTVNNLSIPTSGNTIVTLQSTSAGSPWNIATPSSQISCDYLSIKDSHANPSTKPTWFAGVNSTNVSGNTGWIFSAPVNYYSASSGNLYDVATWGTNTDGSGDNPSDFSQNNCIYNIVNRAAATIDNSWTVSGRIVVGDGTNVCNFTIPESYALSTAAIDVLNNAILTIQNTSIPTLGTLSINSTVVYAGTSMQTATAVNYGNLTINNSAGVTLSAATTALGLLNMANGTLNMSDFALTVGSLTGSGNLTNLTGGTTAQTLTIGSDGTSPLAYSGIISDGTNTGGLTLSKTGSGTLILSGANTYSGLVNILAGTLKLGNSAALGGYRDPKVSISDGAVLDLNGINYTDSRSLSMRNTGISGNGALINSSVTGATYSGLLTLSSATSIVGGSGTINISNTGSIGGNGNNLTLGGAQGGTLVSHLATSSGALTKVDAGTWTLSGGNSSYTGLTTISAGTLKLGAAGFAPNSPLGKTDAGTIVSATDAALDLNGKTLVIAEYLTLNGTGVSNGGALMNSGAAVSYTGLITLGSTSSILGGTGAINISNTGTITGSGFGLTLGGNAGGTLASILGTGTGTLTKIDAGTWTLSGINTYTGATTINAGTLFINGSTTSGSSVSVTSSSATLAGSGTVAGTVSLSGILSPGGTAATIATLNTGDFTFNSNSTYKFEINNATGTAGSNWDKLVSTGAVNVSGSTINIDLTSLSISNFTSSTSYIWTIASGTSIIGFNADNFSVSTANFAPGLGGGTFSVVQSGNDINL
ncbi:MAG: hypothetical protein HGB12_06530, partial [Bacteroidetes bacterium]|nr:hypothetical protein [Bacteroidota bacterium]